MFNTKFSASNNSFDSQLNTNESTGGNDGFSPDIEIQQITNGYRIIITDKDGTESFDIFNGIDGKDGPMGATGPQGPQGAPGRDGAPGEDGIGINSIEINDKGELVLYYSNNTEVNVGKVVGRDGIDGVDGAQGAPGYTPQKGKDYMTDEDISNFVSTVLEQIIFPTVDQTFDANSINAQSGIAVDQAIDTKSLVQIIVWEEDD